VTVIDRIRPPVAHTAPMDRETVQGTITLAATADDAVGVTKVEFLVAGAVVATDTTEPYSVAWNSASKGDGVYSVVAKAWDAAGNAEPSAPVSIVVSNTGNASWNNGVKAPACTTAASKCFTGTLVTGRGPLGPEPNAPNTLGATCADGTQGTYHVDESVDALMVRSDTGTLTVGQTAIVEVRIWAGQAYVMDSLDLYSTPDASASSPIWTRIATLQPTRPGAQVLYASYPLPAGGPLQAVRAQLRYAGAETFVCGDGTFDDRDDLVFAVKP
jgi:leucyl aminopeptidase